MNNKMTVKDKFKSVLEELKEKKKQITFAGVLSGFAMVGVESAYEYTYSLIFPPFDSTKEIISNQNTKFNNIEQSLTSLKSDLSTEQKSLINNVLAQLDEAKKDRDKIVTNLKSIHKDNENLRSKLKNYTNADWGVDIVLNKGTGVKLDDINSFGISDTYQNSRILASLSSPKKENNTQEYLFAGESIKYINDKNKACSITNLGEIDNDIYRFSINCEK